MEGFTRIQFGVNDEKVSRRSRRFRGEQNRKYRLSFGWWPGLVDPETNKKIEGGDLDMDGISPEFRMVQAYYVRGVGYVQDEGPEYGALIGEQSKRRLGTIIVKWPVDAQGQVDKKRLASEDYEVLAWIFSAKRFAELGNIHAEWNLGQVDISAECTKVKFQDFTLNPLKVNLLREIKTGSPLLYQKIMTEISDVAEGIYEEMAQKVGIEDLKRRIALANNRQTEAGGGGLPSPMNGVTPSIDPNAAGVLDNYLTEIS